MILFGKKILVLVLTQAEQPYSTLMHAQQETWYAEPNEHVETFFYAGGLPKDAPDVVQWDKGFLQFKAPDSYYMMHWKFKLALDHLWDRDWDIIFRTNSSAYVNKKNLVRFCSALPNEKVYGGWTLCDSNYDGGYCVSGAGMFLSRDYADILRNELKNEADIEEDVLIGRILRAHGARPFDDQSRVDYPKRANLWRTAYHVRFKSQSRQKDAENMISFHKKIRST